MINNYNFWDGNYEYDIDTNIPYIMKMRDISSIIKNSTVNEIIANTTSSEFRTALHNALEYNKINKENYMISLRDRINNNFAKYIHENILKHTCKCLSTVKNFSELYVMIYAHLNHYLLHSFMRSPNINDYLDQRNDLLSLGRAGFLPISFQVGTVYNDDNRQYYKYDYEHGYMIGCASNYTVGIILKYFREHKRYLILTQGILYDGNYSTIHHNIDIENIIGIRGTNITISLNTENLYKHIIYGANNIQRYNPIFYDDLMDKATRIVIIDKKPGRSKIIGMLNSIIHK